MRVEREAAEPPFALERLAQTSEVARRHGQVRLRNLDEVQPHDGVDLDRMRVGLLAHDLAVDLALGRHVDHDVAGDPRGAAEPPPARERRVRRRRSARRSPTGERCAAEDVMPCFACSPSLTSTWQRPQIPRPPQTESRSTPSRRAASSTVVPSAKRAAPPRGREDEAVLWSRLAMAGGARTSEATAGASRRCITLRRLAGPRGRRGALPAGRPASRRAARSRRRSARRCPSSRRPPRPPCASPRAAGS